MKQCSKCGESKSLKEFSVRPRTKDGLCTQCKVCVSKQSLAYYMNNKIKITIRKKLYDYTHKEEISKKRKKYYIENRAKILAGHKKRREIEKIKVAENQQRYYQANKEAIKERAKLYYKRNKDKIKDYLAKPCKNLKRLKKLPITDQPLQINGYVTVCCKMCGRRFRPTNQQVASRLGAISGRVAGEYSFYCSDACKGACPVYNFKPQNIDPRSKLHKHKSRKDKARSCQTNHLKKIQCEKHGYNYCERCGDIIDVELHHTLTVAGHGEEAINSSGHILLCAGCHADLHSRCA